MTDTTKDTRRAGYQQAINDLRGLGDDPEVDAEWAAYIWHLADKLEAKLAGSSTR